MVVDLQITSNKIDELELAAKRRIAGSIGGVVTFQGIVRESEGGEKISAIDYETFDAMARHQFEKIFAEAQFRWPVRSIRLVHRIGFVPVNEPSLWVEVTAAHRGEAFEACQYLIDQMKLRVPIWKHPRP